MESHTKKAPAEETDGLLVAAAKKIGAAAGAVVSMTGMHEAAPKAAPAPVVGKLPKKNKTRLPRRQKKASQRAGRHKAA